MPIHLRPTAKLAERVLLPGDPGRALALAQLLIDGPLMFNHHRGLWGYTGPTIADGEPLTIQSTGMGGPSAAIVLHELIALGAQRAIRVGTCGALAATEMLVDSGMRAELVSPESVRGECHPAPAGGLALGDLVVAHEALATDGASRSLGAGARIAADRALTAALARAANGNGSVARTHGNRNAAQTAGSERQSPAERSPHPGATIVSTDLFYEPNPDREREWRAAGAVAVEMEAAALFAVGARAGIPVACVLTVSNLLGGDPGEQQEHIDDDTLLTAAEAMGRAAVSALV
jgi:uridine phosphorylase